jgi:polysaccharide chain length determinant protein (PEP-CTERM system associated)
MMSVFADFQLEDILELIDRRKWWLAMGVAVGLALGLLAYVVLPPIYLSSTTILVEPQEIPRDFVKSTVTLTVSQRLRTLSERVTSYANLTSLIDAVGQDVLDPSGALGREAIMGVIRGNLDVQLQGGKGSPVFQISYRDDDPERAAAVTRQVADLFVAENIKDRAAQATTTAEFLDHELEKLAADLDRMETDFANFRKSQSGSLPDQLDANLHQLERLDQSVLGNREAQTQVRERIALLQERMTSPLFAEDGMRANSPAGQLIGLRARLRNAERVYTEEHPNLVRLRNEIARVEKEVEAAAAAAEAGDLSRLDPTTRGIMVQIDREELQLAALQRKEAALQVRIEEVERRVEETPELTHEMQAMLRHIGNLQGTYRKLLTKKQEASLARNLEMAQKGERFKVLRPARAPRFPASPSLWITLPAGVAASLLVVLVLVLVSETRNPSFRSVARLTRSLGLPVLASVPRIDDDRIFEDGPPDDVDPRLVVHTAPESAPAEQYRSFVPVFLEDEKRRVILVTSAARGDGKSLTCMNLALTVARDVNRRVLLIDADLRRPTAHRLLRVRAPAGLTEVLEGSASFEETVITTQIPNLSLLPAGRATKNPLTLLTDKTFLQLLEDARNGYDAIFIDSPPLMPVVDTKLLRKLADMVVFVVRADATPREAVLRSLKEMREVAGVVFNQVSAGSFRRYYYHDAYSRYAYGEPDDSDDDA